jgi:serine/threonine-protein kinase
MDTPEDSASLTKALLDDELIDLEPTVQLEIEHGHGRRPRVGVEMVEGTFASLIGELASLHRRRLGAAGLFLSAVFLVLFFWSLLNHPAGHWLAPIATLVRFAIAAVCTGLILSRVPWTDGQVRAIEYVLFGSLTLVLVFSQYVVNLERIQEHDIAGVITHMKNGVIGTIVLMVIYGMFIPNNARHTAFVVFTMAMAVLFGFALFMERSDVDAAIEQLRSSEHAGTNAIILLIGAALATYGSYVLNGLRTELHAAKKFGQYQLREKLGVGGMGEVYLAEHQLLKRPCALKLIKPEAGADPIALARFEREVQSAARLSHPNTIEIYDYGHTDDGTFYYVMEFLPGVSLQDLVDKHGPLPVGRVIFIFRQVCAGLAEAHALGLVHRDLKPANIFVAFRGGEADVAKVLDFGLVKPTRDEGAVELTSDHRVSGTPLYMAPEQATGDRSLDARADIYSMGAMIYFSLTGGPPFKFPTAFEVMMAHARDPVVPPSKLRPEIPADVEAVVLKCLAKKPQDRYADVKAVGKALAACDSAREWDVEKAEAWWAEVNESKLKAHDA